MLNAFKYASVTHVAVGLWRHPLNQSTRYRSIDFWQETARMLERAKFDAVFIADAINPLDAFRGSADVAVRDGIGTPSIDPSLLVSAIAAATERIGVAITFSTGYEHPVDLARKLTTLDHLTAGRVGWNIVTTEIAGRARTLGLDAPLAHDDRYVAAEEFLDLVYALWESSWEPGAVIADRAAGVYADPERVHRVEHHGERFDHSGIFVAEPSPQRTPALFQAGTSAAGRAFAARHAEGVFISHPTLAMTASYVAGLRDELEAAGRRRDDAKVFAMATIVVGETDEEAWAKVESYRRFQSIEGNLARFSAIIGIDLAELDPDTPLTSSDAPGTQGVLRVFTEADPDRRWTPREIAEFLSLRSTGALFVGSPQTIADELEAWVDEADVDGFNIADTISSVTYPEFIALVLPELRRRGRVWADYEGTTQREYLLGAGVVRPSPTHPSARYRVGTDGTT